MNFVFYTISTSLLLLYFLKGKKIEKNLKIILEKFSNFIFLSLGIKLESLNRILSFLFYILESIIIVLFIQYFYIGNFQVPTGSMKPKIMPGDRYLADMVSYNFIDPKRGQIIIFKSPTNEVYFCKRLMAFPGERVKIGNDNKIYINGEKLESNNDYYKYTSVNDLIFNSSMNDKEWSVPKKGDSIELQFAIFKYMSDEGKISKDIWEMRRFLNSMKDREAINFLKKVKKDFKLEVHNSRVILNNKNLTGIIMDEDILLKLIKGEKINLRDDYYFVLGDNSLQSDDSRDWGFVRKDRIKGRPLIRWWPLDRIDFVHSYPY